MAKGEKHEKWRPKVLAGQRLSRPERSVKKIQKIPNIQRGKGLARTVPGDFPTSYHETAENFGKATAEDTEGRETYEARDGIR